MEFKEKPAAPVAPTTSFVPVSAHSFYDFVAVAGASESSRSSVEESAAFQHDNHSIISEIASEEDLSLIHI